MRWVAEVHVRLHEGIADPEGTTIAGGLRALGFETVRQVRAGKLLRIGFASDDRASAEQAVAEMCRRLLANPVMETADWDLREDREPTGAVPTGAESSGPEPAVTRQGPPR